MSLKFMHHKIYSRMVQIISDNPMIRRLGLLQEVVGGLLRVMTGGLPWGHSLFLGDFSKEVRHVQNAQICIHPVPNRD